LRDHGSGNVGSASQFIDVPDIKKNRLVLSGILVNAAEFSPVAKPSGSPAPGADQSSPGVDATSKQQTGRATMNAATRQFKRGEVLDYSVIVYNARLDKASSQPQLRTQMRLFREGEAVFTGKEIALVDVRQPDLKRITVIGALKLGAELIPGEYVLQLTVTDPLADEKHQVAAQWIDFEVVK